MKIFQVAHYMKKHNGSESYCQWNHWYKFH